MHFTQDTILREIESLYEYREFLKDAIQKEENKIKERFDAAKDSMDVEDFQSAFDNFVDDAVLIKHNFEKFSIHGFVILLYSTVDECLKKYCCALYKDNKASVSPKIPDFMEKPGIEKYKIYLNKYTNQNVNFGGQPWKELTTLQKIRKRIVHNNTEADGDLFDETEKLRKEGLLEIEEKTNHKNETVYSHIKIYQSYLDHVLKYVRQFFEELLGREIIL